MLMRAKAGGKSLNVSRFQGRHVQILAGRLRGVNRAGLGTVLIFPSLSRQENENRPRTPSPYSAN